MLKKELLSQSALAVGGVRANGIRAFRQFDGVFYEGAEWSISHFKPDGTVTLVNFPIFGKKGVSVENLINLGRPANPMVRWQ